MMPDEPSADPQPLSLCQRRVARFARRHGLLHDPVSHALDLASEVGEVAKEILRATDYGGRVPRFGPRLKGELGDALYSLLTLAEACGEDAGQALDESLAKVERRLRRSGQPGSHTAEA